MNQQGRSMIEMLGVLAIVGVLSVGGISGYSRAMTKFKTNNTLDAMMTIASNIRTKSLSSKDYTDIDKAAIKMKLIPDKFLSADGQSLGVNAFGGSLDISNYGTRSFYVAMNGLPREVCLDIATKDFGNALVYAGGSEFSASSVGLAATNLRTAAATCDTNYCIKKVMSPSVASGACDCASSYTCSVAVIIF